MLVAVTRIGYVPGGSRWLCKCDCGATREVILNKLRRGETQSCGCSTGALISAAITIHGWAKTPTWNTWISMRRRCTQPSDKLFPYYGGRGIRVCDAWQESFEQFFADMGERPTGMSIDRIDNNGDYAPENCRWATTTQQARNRRSTVMVEYEGRRMSLAEACEKAGISRRLVDLRLRRNWPDERLFLPPVTPHDRIDAAWRK